MRKHLEFIRIEMAKQGIDYLLVNVDTSTYGTLYCKMSKERWLASMLGTITEGWLLITPQRDRLIYIRPYGANIDHNALATNDIVLREVDFLSQLITYHKVASDDIMSSKLQPSSVLQNVFPCQKTTHTKSSFMTLQDNMWLVNHYLALNPGKLFLCNHLDHIAWLLGIRHAMTYPPLHNAFLLCSYDDILLFCDDMTELCCDVMFAVKPVHTLESFLRKKLITGDHRSLPAQICYKFEVEHMPILWRMQHIKTDEEITHSIKAHIIDSALFIKIWYWIKMNLHHGFSEYDLSYQIDHIRKNHSSYLYKSFDNIVAFNEHGFVLHYHPTPLHSSLIAGHGVLVIDIGAHYLLGTTDVTRTLFIGTQPSYHEKDLYTKVLKSHLHVARACPNQNIATIVHAAIQYLQPYNCPHALGHGIGYMLSVHEPALVLSEYNHEYLDHNMIFTNEPGIYTPDFGIRIENAHYVAYNRIETLTFVPYDNNLILWEHLTRVEKQQLSDYGKSILQHMHVHLTTDEYHFLRSITYVG